MAEIAVTHEHNRSLYMGKRTLLTNVSPTVARIVGGLLLTGTAVLFTVDDGYFVVFALLLALYGWTFHHARDIESLKGVEFRLRDSLRRRSPPGWRGSLWSQLFRGLTDVPITILAPVMIYIVIDQELVVSTFTSAVTLLAGACGLLAGRLLQHNNRGYLIGAIGMPLGLIIFGSFAGWPGLAGYVLAVGIAMSFSSIPVATAIYDAMNRSALPWQRQYHFLIENEVVLNTGRTISFLLVLLLVPITNQAPAVREIILCLAIAPIIVGILQHHVNKQLFADRNAAASDVTVTTGA